MNQVMASSEPWDGSGDNFLTNFDVFRVISLTVSLLTSHCSGSGVPLLTSDDGNRTVADIQ